MVIGGNFMILDIEGHSKNYPYSQMPSTGANSTPTSNPIMYNSTIKENNTNEYVKAAVFINKFITWNFTSEGE